ncbi:beta-glucuronidase [Limosilactobacillus caccae]|uniref:beta-glucuronidase n=1 Tax=Limosilactobacillus caccae TaxID=1926284 RepID=UPI001F32755F|nr:beta-glucuronidase [Limosilactobacillus caccae]
MMLYPEQTATRTLADLTGLWKFKIEDGHVDPAKPLRGYEWMAVPASYNDQVTDLGKRNRVGYFWYETNFSVPVDQLKKRNVLRFGSVTQNAEVFLNGQEVGKHIGGFTPFEFEVNKYLKAGDNNLKIRLNNLLDNTTVPSALQKNENGELSQQNRFDFYNYAGIHRKVQLYTTAQTYLEYVAVNYKIDGEKTFVHPDIKIIGGYDQVVVTILDEEGKVVARGDEEATLTINSTHRWQPLNAYLYRLQVKIYVADKLVDSYNQEFGVRTIEVKQHQFFINGKPFYFKGFGWHEDSVAHGKGENLPQVNLDLNIMEKMGANSFRTSHYPYSEETMRLADRKGFVVIDEVPAVGLYENFAVTLGGSFKEGKTWKNLDPQANHKLALREMIERDHDHPSVVMWSVANEPASHEPGAHEYFADIIRCAKQMDPQKRPVTVVNIMNADAEKDLIGDLVDVICLNRYYGWYVDFGKLELAKKQLKVELEKWHKKFPEKPILFTEFGADTIAGMHSLYHAPYSEEYQVDYYQANFAVFDSCEYVQGEQLWNFADFVTEPGMIRVGAENRKGVFTRDRRPKQVVQLLRQRWRNK